LITGDILCSDSRLLDSTSVHLLDNHYLVCYLALGWLLIIRLKGSSDGVYFNNIN